jgi:archaellin
VAYDYDDDAGLYYTLGSPAADPFVDEASDLLGEFTRFSLEISPVRGAPLSIERTTPQSLNEVMNLR